MAGAGVERIRFEGRVSWLLHSFFLNGLAADANAEPRDQAIGHSGIRFLIAPQPLARVFPL